jgi:hypothetical protein
MHPRDFAAGFEATALHRVLKGLPSNCVKNPATVMFAGKKAGACSFSDMALGRLLRYLPLGLAVHAAAVAVRLVPTFPAFPLSILSAADIALAANAPPVCCRGLASGAQRGGQPVLCGLESAPIPGSKGPGPRPPFRGGGTGSNPVGGKPGETPNSGD